MKTFAKIAVTWYLPVEVADFILRSVDAVLKKKFNRTLADKDIHIIEPFVGTGTFIVRLIQLGLIPTRDLIRKYKNKEIWANEIMLLAYYIAAVNIENAFHDAAKLDEYIPFPGICLTDTFQAYEDDKQQTLEINATLKSKVYDSYVKAFRWASDRITEGIIDFVTNAGWLDGAAMDGLRKCFADEFAEIYIFNLRGNQRTQGETSRREGGKIFGSGSRAPIAITTIK